MTIQIDSKTIIGIIVGIVIYNVISLIVNIMCIIRENVNAKAFGCVMIWVGILVGALWMCLLEPNLPAETNVYTVMKVCVYATVIIALVSGVLQIAKSLSSTNPY